MFRSSRFFASLALVGAFLVSGIFQVFAQSAVNPFEQMDSGVRDCVKNALGEARYNELASGASFAEEDGSKIKSANCFQSYSRPVSEPVLETPQKSETPSREEVKPEGVESSGTQLDPKMETCMRETFGEERHNAMKKGEIQPTEEEMKKGKTCFTKTGQEIPRVEESPGKEMSDKTMQCMKLAIGEKRFEQMMKGEIEPSPEDRAAAERCFGGKNYAAAPQPEMKMSAEIMSCLKNAVGEARFNAISAGQDRPTSVEEEKGRFCFEKEKKKGDSAAKVLPPDPKEVPFIKEDKATVEITKVEAGDTTITIEGVGPKNSVIDIYIYSEPTRVSVATAQNGAWLYKLEKELGGVHTAYAAAKKKGETVRSPAASIQAVEEAAAATTIPQITEEGLNKTRLLAAIIVGFVTLFLAGLFIWFGARRRD